MVTINNTKRRSRINITIAITLIGSFILSDAVFNIGVVGSYRPTWNSEHRTTDPSCQPVQPVDDDTQTISYPLPAIKRDMNGNEVSSYI